MSKNIKKADKPNVRWLLVAYDLVIYAAVCFAFLVLYKGFSFNGFMGWHYAGLGALCIFFFRFVFNIYKLIWRYGGVQSYCKLILADALAFLLFTVINYLPFLHKIALILALDIFFANLLLALSMRMIYWYIYKCGTKNTKYGKYLGRILEFFSFGTVTVADQVDVNKIKIGIIGAGSLGTSLAEEMLENPNAPYSPRCFIDDDKDKAGRYIHNLPVLSDSDDIARKLNEMDVQELVLAINGLSREKKKELYEYYNGFGLKMKVYDFPIMANAETGKRMLREFDIEDLLFRKQVVMEDEKTKKFFKNKTVMITGGGGSIGSELCRQLAKMGPKRIVIVDIYENGAYDVQQELRLAYGRKVKINIEIVSVTNKVGLERAFEEHHPQIVINAAAHKHVPLMEKNCIEAVENNVFGTLNTVELSEKYGVQRFIQVSTDKAVNPTNVMGATKRLCEMIIQCHALANRDNPDVKTTFSATRFGNVLGSAGSVIPLFKRQIANGGPVTITDRRIIRYFMTIPEASQLVLQSGAMAKNGELFVLNMGKPVKICDLAENMIRLSGLEPGYDIQILETGLRPGEKLYEELLIQSENLTKTRNSLIFIEKDEPVSPEELDRKLKKLRAAIKANSDAGIKKVMEEVVPTYHMTENIGAAMDVFPEEKIEEIESGSLGLKAVEGKRVLVVDDISLNRDIAVDTFIEMNMEADSAEDGEKAIDMLKMRGAGYYDFVMMDLVMPNMNGYEATKAIRKMPGFEDLIIIAMTASESEDKDKALEAGMNAFIQKPVHLDDLLEAVMKLEVEE